MTENEVQATLDQIVKFVNGLDYEAAHAVENALMVAVVQHFADNGSELAKLALKSTKIRSKRYCS